jgi:hypothetical protein
MSWHDDLMKLAALAVKVESLGQELADLASKITKRVEVEAQEGAVVSINIKEKE